MKHLEDAKMYVGQAESVSTELMQAYAQLAIAHALIAICERLPPLAETASEYQARLRKEEQDGV